MKAVAETRGVSRFNLHDRLKESAKPRRNCHTAQDAAVLPRIKRLVAKRPTYGCRPDHPPCGPGNCAWWIDRLSAPSASSAS